MKKRFKKIYVEITNNCNLDCSFCNKNKRDKMFISIDNFNTLLDKVKDYTDHLYFHVIGEPLLHPNINELIDIASKDFFVNITTNGYLIKRIESNKNIRKLSISLHSYDSKYNKSLDEYLNTIFDTVDKLLEYGTIIEYRLWIDRENNKEILNKLESKYKVKIDSDSIKIKNNLFFATEKEFIWPTFNNDYDCDIGSCLGTRDHVGILVDGTAVPCCLDSEGIINLGNVYKNDLNDIISSDLFKQINKGFLCNKKAHPLCKKCNFYELRR